MSALEGFLELLRIATIIIGSFCVVVTVYRFPKLMKAPLLKQRVASLSWAALLITIVEGNIETLILGTGEDPLVGPRTMLCFLAVCWTLLALTLHDGGIHFNGKLPWWERGRLRASEWLQVQLIRQSDQ